MRGVMEAHTSKVFISGGTSGIGLGIVKKYLKEGHFVVINYNKGGASLSETCDILEKIGFAEKVHFSFLQADVSKESSLFAALDSQKELLQDVGILINNAGILIRGHMNDLTEQDWLGVFGVNVFGCIFLTKWFSKNSEKLNNIINIGSIRGLPSVTRVNNPAYSVSKSSIPSLTAVMAKTYGPNIRVNAIIPGTIDTKQRQGITKKEEALYGESNAIMNRLGKPREVANLCHFITSPDNEYMTGSTITIDGGYSVNYIR